MTRLVAFFAPRSTIDFIFKFCLIEAMVVCFALAVMMLTHGGFPFGLQRQVIDTAIMGAPFVLLALFVVSHQRRLQQELASIATTDLLTQLNNRRGFLEKAETWLEANPEGTFLLADVDHFKSINDTFGHDTGDACLIAVADRLRQLTGEADLVGRIGGEEFALCIAQDSDPNVIANALARGIFPEALGERRVTLSVGGIYVVERHQLSQLMQLADRYLYLAKADGRARAILGHAEQTKNAVA